jgi:broad specificity phosphatase PhoE
VGYYFSDLVLCCCYLFFHHYSSMALPMLGVYGECAGNFQNRERMQLQKAARIRYGRFFYRFPNGESAADVYDRITGFRETLRSDIDVGRFQRPEARSKSMNLILVSHGLTLRVFLMRWYKWTVEQFEGLWNFGNTGMLVMQLGPGGRCILMYQSLCHHKLCIGVLV